MSPAWLTFLPKETSHKKGTAIAVPWFFKAENVSAYLATEAPKPASLTALIKSSLDTLLSAVTTALSGILTSALETPSTPSSADRTFLTQPTPHVMPVTLSSTDLVSASSALISLAALVLPAIGPAVTMPRGRAAMAHSASNFCVGFIFFLLVGLLFVAVEGPDSQCKAWDVRN